VSRYFILLFSLLVLFLSACGSVIPPQTLPDPIGVKGQQVQVEIGAANRLRTQASGFGIIRSTFNDIDTSSAPIAINISQSLFKVGFAAETVLDTTATILPCGISLTDVTIDVTLSDSEATYTLPSFKVNKLVELEQDKTDLTRYRIVTPDAFVGIVLTGSDVAQLQKIITSGGNNTVEVRVSVQTASVPDLPPGSVMTFTFDTSEAELTF